MTLFEQKTTCINTNNRISAWFYMYGMVTSTLHICLQYVLVTFNDDDSLI